MVTELAYLCDPILVGVSTLGRVTQARQVCEQRSDKV